MCVYLFLSFKRGNLWEALLHRRSCRLLKSCQLRLLHCCINVRRGSSKGLSSHYHSSSPVIFRKTPGKRAWWMILQLFCYRFSPNVYPPFLSLFLMRSFCYSIIFSYLSPLSLSYAIFLLFHHFFIFLSLFSSLTFPRSHWFAFLTRCWSNGAEKNNFEQTGNSRETCISNLAVDIHLKRHLPMKYFIEDHIYQILHFILCSIKSHLKRTNK